MKRQTSVITAFFLANLSAALGGCGEPPPATSNQTTYYHDIKPLMQRYCEGCHRTGDIAPFALTDYNSIMSHAPQITTAVQAGSMPPWMPSDAGMPLRYSRELRPQDKALLLDWLAAGAPAGDAASPARTDIPPAEQESPPRADLVLKAAQPYQPDTSSTDDYRCFLFDPKNDHDRFLVAGQVKPDNRAITHHMALFLVPAAQADQVRKLDPDGKGYTCFAGPAKNAPAELVLGWAPGGTSMRTPAGTAFRIATGSILVMQMHYNVVANNGKPDQTSVELELSDTPPAHELVSLFVAKPNLQIKMGDANSVQTMSLPVTLLAKNFGLPAGSLRVYGAFPHMHLLGKRIALSIADGPMIIEIPHWDFHWQNAYNMVTPYDLRPSDSLNIECDYDNSYENQPVIMGQRQPPRDVKWGESTLDEMCITVLTVASTN